MRKGLFALSLAAAVWAVLLASPSPGDAGGLPKQRDDAVAAGRKLSAEGRWDEALSAYGRRGSRLGDDLLGRIAQGRGGDADALRKLYDAYLHYYPFGYPYWHNDWRKWGKAACDYADLLTKAARADADERARQTVAAVGVYRKLMAAHGRSEEAEVRALAGRIVRDHPRSVFCGAAVLSVANVVAQKRCNGAEAAGICEEYLPLLAEGRAGPRARIVVQLVLAHACADFGRDAGRLRKAVHALLEVAEKTDVTYEKRACLLRAAQAAAKIAEPDDLARARKLFGDFLAAGCAAPEADQARRGFVGTYLTAGRPDQALQALRDLEKRAAQAADFSQPLFDVSRAFFAKARYDDALAILTEIVKRFGQGGAAPMAYLGMGEVYEKLGREAKAVEAYKMAAAKPPVETRTNIMDASDTRNRAHVWLGTHYMKKQDWAEALKWWQAWRPRSWCGTCQAGMESRKAHAVAVCLVKAGKTDEALKALEPFVLRDHFASRTDVAVMLVDLYRGRGKLGEIEARLREALAKSPHNAAAKTGIEYVALLRLAEKKDVEALWKHLDGHPYLEYAPKWNVARAADLLAAMPETTKPYALEKMKATGHHVLWAAVLLGRIKAPETLALVREKVRAEENCWCLRDYFYALAMLGTEQAYAQLTQYAAAGKGNRKSMAQQILKRYPNAGDAAAAVQVGSSGRDLGTDRAATSSAATSRPSSSDR